MPKVRNEKLTPGSGGESLTSGTRLSYLPDVVAATRGRAIDDRFDVIEKNLMWDGDERPVPLF